MLLTSFQNLIVSFYLPQLNFGCLVLICSGEKISWSDIVELQITVCKRKEIFRDKSKGNPKVTSLTVLVCIPLECDERLVINS